MTQRIPRRPTAVLLALVFSLTALATSVATVGAATSDGLVSVANGHRADAGRPAVSVHAATHQVSSERAVQMASTGDFSHDFAYIERRFEELGVCWSGFGEIIAWHSGPAQPDLDRFGRQWEASEPHRKIMLGSYTHAGAGVATASDGRHYAAMIWITPCAGGGSGGAASGGFTDIGSSAFRSDIEWLAASGITSGCTATRFCPRGTVTREQMASFLARGLKLGASGRDYFVDDGASAHHANINRVAAASVAAGCAQARYCPTRSVTRGQMASFLVRALGLPATGRDHFTDDETSVHEADINRLAAAGIARGCGGSRFCPNAPVTREEMAAFLRRALGS